MELLDKLETHISELLARLDQLKAENARLAGEADAAVAAMASLKEENRRLREIVTQDETMRNEALKRIDALLHKIQEHDSIA